MRRIILLLITGVFLTTPAWAQTYQTTIDGTTIEHPYAEEGGRGYRYYDTSGDYAGYSEADSTGVVTDYYDDKGNKIGSVESNPQDKDSYVVYDESGVAIGEMVRNPSGKYDLKPYYEGGTTQVDVTPQDLSEDVGQVNPFTLFNK